MSDAEPLCDQCGKRPGVRQKWMIYRIDHTVFGPPAQHEQFCQRCYRLHQIYSVIGMTILLLILATAVVASVWALWFAGP